MIKQSTAVLMLSGAIALGGLCGCTSPKKEKLAATRTRVSTPQDSFAAGAGRAPTAATSHAYAKILIAQGRDRDALYVLERTVREHPKFIAAYNDMAEIFVRADRIDDAIDALQSGLKQSPNDPVLHNNLGMCRLLDGAYEPALQAFTRAAELMPTNPTFRANRAAALALLGHGSEAEKEFRSVLGKGATKENLAILERARTSRNESEPVKELAAPALDHSNSTSDAHDFDPSGDPELAPEASDSVVVKDEQAASSDENDNACVDTECSGG
jgi:Flp pilus assembly protein TadD